MSKLDAVIESSFIARIQDVEIRNELLFNSANEILGELSEAIDKVITKEIVELYKGIFLNLYFDRTDFIISDFEENMKELVEAAELKEDVTEVYIREEFSYQHDNIEKLAEMINELIE